MLLNGNQTSLRSDGLAAQIGSGMPREIDLYEDLVAFAEMTPDEQRRYLCPAETPPATNVAEAMVVEAQKPVSTDSCELDVAESISELDSTASDLNLAEQAIETGSEIGEAFEAGEPFIDLGPYTELDTELDTEFAGALTGTTCPECEAELGIDDLFCAECGSFLNGIPSAPASDQICADCSQSVSIEEVFCPWCGSVLGAD